MTMRAAGRRALAVGVAVRPRVVLGERRNDSRHDAATLRDVIETEGDTRREGDREKERERGTHARKH
eukprot:1812000-Pyramimonas_sp.AAC.1